MPTNWWYTFFAYMLSHQYSINDLEDSRIEVLKGGNKYKVGYAQDLAKQLGYMLHLVSIK